MRARLCPACGSKLRPNRLGRLPAHDSAPGIQCPGVVRHDREAMEALDEAMDAIDAGLCSDCLGTGRCPVCDGAEVVGGGPCPEQCHGGACAGCLGSGSRDEQVRIEQALDDARRRRTDGEAL